MKPHARCNARNWAVIAVLGLALRTFAAEDPLASLRTFSSFTSVDISRLSKGEVLTDRGDGMDFVRGISGEACYVVRKEPAAVARFIISSDPSKGAPDSVYYHKKFSGVVPDSVFVEMKLDDSKFGQRRVVGKTLEVGGGKADFFMSKAEMVRFEEVAKQGRAAGLKPAEIAAHCWSSLFVGRATAFLKSGLDNLDTYETGRAPVKPADEMRQLLDEVPEVREHFRGLLSQTGLLGSPNAAPRLAPACYAELMNAQVSASFDLGAIFVKELPGGEVQVLDCQYYSSAAYYVSLTLFHLWPIQVDGAPATLAWRGDLLSAPLLEVTHGTARMAWGLVMMREIKQSIQIFQKDILKAP
jgi:hypothetical protein